MSESEKPETNRQESVSMAGSAKTEEPPKANGQTNVDHKDNPKDDSKPTDKDEKPAEEKPAGGYDATPLPKATPGWTIKITIHKAENLPPADMATMSSDPYVMTQLYCQRALRHKEDPLMKWRTFTVRKNVNPEWNEEWIVANVPSSGFKLKCRLYDEDSSDHDDRLGNVHIDVPHLSEDWHGFRERIFKIRKHMGSKRAYLIQAFSTCMRIRDEMSGHLVVSIQLLGRTESQYGGRVYTVGPIRWMKHYSPLFGRMVGKKTPLDPNSDAASSEKKEKSKTEKYKYVCSEVGIS
jgi:hypothetical protein